MVQLYFAIGDVHTYKSKACTEVSTVNEIIVKMPQQCLRAPKPVKPKFCKSTHLLVLAMRASITHSADATQRTAMQTTEVVCLAPFIKPVTKANPESSGTTSRSRPWSSRA